VESALCFIYQQISKVLIGATLPDKSGTSVMVYFVPSIANIGPILIKLASEKGQATTL